MRVSAFGWLARSVLRSGSSTAGTAPPLVPPSRASRARTLAGGAGVDGGRSGGAVGPVFAGMAAGGAAVMTGSSTATGTTSSATWLSPDFRPVASITAAGRAAFPLRAGAKLDRDESVGVDVGGRQPFASAEEGELEQDAGAGKVNAGLRDERRRSGHRAAGGEDVVHDQHAVAGRERVALDLEDG